MKVVRDRADAYWLPQRFRFATFRLLAYALFRTKRRRSATGIALGIDRDQTAIEHYTIAIWLTVAATLFAYGALSKIFAPSAALIMAPLVSTVFLQAIQVWAVVLPRRLRWINRVDFNSFLTLGAVIVPAVYFATQSGWIRWAAWSVLAVVLLNAAAAVVLALLHTSILARTEDLIS